jgi:tetratricopeptide (TPR) repeat protein
LNEISHAQLIRRAEGEPNAFWFKHALVQDTTYASLLRQDRKRLHRLVAETLERLNPERLDELAPRLAEHFEEAGETARALVYLERAAENAAARYANREALGFYTRALDAAQALHTDTRDSLHRARGVVYERVGRFDEACADLETALRIAEQDGDTLAEWQSLMDLGFAWTARDYARAGEYFEKALDLARASGDTARIAHSLNRVGNWYVNKDEPQRATVFHGEALEMFEARDDARGLAETQDYLSMASWIGADYANAEKHADTALALFESLGDPLAIANMRIVSYVKYAMLQGSTVAASANVRPVRDDEIEVLQELRQLGWRAGEAFGLMVLGEAFAAYGDYARGLEWEREAAALAREINHSQWLAGATMLYGEILAQLLNFERAQPYLENALALARDLGSAHWVLMSSSFLACTLIAQNKLNAAQAILDAALTANPRAQSVGQRQVWAARVELSLAQHNTDAALEALDLLWRDSAQVTPDTVIPRLWLLRAQAMRQKNDLARAERLLHAAHEQARHAQQPGWEWRSAAALAQLYRAQGRDDDAQDRANHAQAIVKRLSNPLSDTTLRENFLGRAMQMIWDA